MAKLHPHPYLMPEQDVENWKQWIDESRKALDAIPADRLYSESVADGYAYYYVVSKKPLILQHIPFLDGYRLMPHVISGLRLQDVEANIQSNAVLQKLMKSQQAKSAS